MLKLFIKLKIHSVRLLQFEIITLSCDVLKITFASPTTISIMYKLIEFT